MSDERDLLRRTAELAADYLDSLGERPVFPQASMEEIAGAFDRMLPQTSSDPLRVVEELARAVEPGVIASAGGRYFGYVTGSALPATIAADWLTAIWDQCAGLGPLGPSVGALEVVVGEWLKDLFGLPPSASFAITTGCQMAHVTALAAARHEVLSQRDWDVRERGLAESPPISVVVGRLRHVTVDRALRLLGVGASQLVVVPADDPHVTLVRLHVRRLEAEADVGRDPKGFGIDLRDGPVVDVRDPDGARARGDERRATPDRDGRHDPVLPRVDDGE